MNASDTWSKRTLEEQISHSLSNKTMDGFLLSNFCKIWNEFYIIKMLYSFSCLTKLIFLCSLFIIINWVSYVNYSSIGQLFPQNLWSFQADKSPSSIIRKFPSLCFRYVCFSRGVNHLSNTWGLVSFGYIISEYPTSLTHPSATCVL